VTQLNLTSTNTLNPSKISELLGIAFGVVTVAFTAAFTAILCVIFSSKCNGVGLATICTLIYAVSESHSIFTYFSIRSLCCNAIFVIIFIDISAICCSREKLKLSDAYEPLQARNITANATSTRYRANNSDGACMWDKRENIEYRSSELTLVSNDIGA
jgi:hypothetical protein